MTAYELSSGRKIWQKYDRGTYQARVTVVDDKIVYGTTEGRLIMRVQEDGEKVYEIDLGSPIESEITFDNGRLFLQLRSHQVFALDAITGKILWSYKRGVPPGTTNQSSASPLIVGQQLVVGFADGHLVSFNKFDGQMNWEKNLAEKLKFNDVDISPVLVGEHLLSYSNGSALAVVDKKGTLIQKVLEKPSSSIIKIDGLIYFGDLNGDLIVLNPNYTVLKRVPLTYGPLRFVQAWKNYLVATSVTGEVVVVDRTNDQIIKEFHAGGRQSSFVSPMDVGQDYLTLTSSLGRLMVFR